jgi:hypothetical protein
VKPATTCTWIHGQTATASIDILQINKKVSRLALGHMPISYSMGTAKAEDEYISTPHMPPWCGQGKPYLYLYCRPNYAHQDFETYYENIPHMRRAKTGTKQLQDQNTFIQGTTVTGQQKAISYYNNMTLMHIKDDSNP